MTNTSVAKRRSTKAASVLLAGLTLVGLTFQHQRADSDEAAGAPLEATSERTPEFSEAIEVSEAELAEWETTTAVERAEIVRNMQEAFAGVAEIGVAGDDGAPVQELLIDGEAVDVQPVLAYGASWRHVWITASYADVASGAVWAGVRYCIARSVPAWICNTAGNKLTEWARGWGWASNHGVWAEIFWAPAHVNGGRW